MRAVVQRVKKASVSVEGSIVSEINGGLLVLVGITEDDSDNDIEYIADKCIQMRVFDDSDGVMNLSALDTGSSMLVVSQFTLYGDIRKGRRPNYMKAAGASLSLPIYEKTVQRFSESGLTVKTGVFGAEMDVNLINDGPVTILLDSRKAF